MGSRSITLYLESMLPPEPKEKPTPVVAVNPRLSPILMKYIKTDPGLAQNVATTLQTLERDAITRARLRLNKT